MTLAIFYTWFTFILLFKEDMYPRTYPPYQNEKIAVAIPCYNEDPALLKKSLTSIVNAYGNKEIIVINDGSTKNVTEINQVLQDFIANHNIKIHAFEKNKGKRMALHKAIKDLIIDAKYVVTVDSDSILDKNALVRIIRPLKDKRIGASSGDVQLLNEQQNLLTRMIGAYYWVALHIHRKSQSGAGMVSCCSGALAAYKVSLLKPSMDAFVEQEFFGEKCTYSDDRHLTNIILKTGHDVVFVEDAIVYTLTPSTLRKFIKQQLRWRRGFLKEATFALSFSWKTKPLLFFETLLWEIVLPFVSLNLSIIILFNFFFDIKFFLTGIVPSLFLLLIIRNLPLIYKNPRKLFGLFLYMIFSNFVMYWLGYYALFTLRNKNWATR